ncbi:MAG TPA: PKD domain-containing protein [Thermoanaerobaculia bacterium]|nr:PKD domain-containing protein [Thermoanaerobaculia bacterium]
MRSRAFILRILATAFVLTTASLPLFAWNYDTCFGNRLTWSGNSPGFTAANVSFSNSTTRNALEAAMGAWNIAPATNFRFGLSYGNLTAATQPNFSNEIIFSYDGFDANTLATTYKVHNCANITEKDVVFNAGRTWSFSTNPVSLPTRNDSAVSFPLVAIHELGHALGLNHQNSTLATMSPLYPNGGPVGNMGQQYFQPLPDDVHGDRVGYGTCCAVRDLVASAYGSYNETQTGPIIPASEAYRGRRTGFGFSVGNRGSVSETVQVKFYFSTDRWIDTSDMYLGSTTVSLAPGAVNPAAAVYYDFPLNFPLGIYYFGYIVDPSNTIGEADEANNAVAMGTPTTVPAFTPPYACYTANPTSGIAPLTVSFDGSCSSDPDGYVATYSWSFGDGAMGSGATPSHYYATPGFYTVTLTVTDNQGKSQQTSDTVWAQDPSGCIICS